MGVFRGNSKVKLFLGEDKVKKAYLGETKLYSAGNIVTYYVDNGVTYQEEVDSDATCLAPSTFTPTKSGWTFVGWREDTTASADVLGSKVMGDEPVTLYAVFTQAVSVSWYNASTPVVETKQRYYNNGNIVNPSFARTVTAKSGWSVIGWSTNTTTDGSYSYGSGGSFTVESSIALYAKYQRTLTLTYYDNSTVAQTKTGTQYYTPHDDYYRNPSFTMTQSTISGWTAYGWAITSSAAASATYSNGATITLTGNLTIYGCYYQIIYLYYNGNGATGGSTATQSDRRYYNAAGNYYNPTFTLASNGFSRTNYGFNGWNLGAAGATVTLSTSTTAYAQWVKLSNPYTWISGYYGYGATLTVNGNSNNDTTVFPTSCFKVGYRDDITQETGFNIYTNTVNTNGCKYMYIDVSYYPGSKSEGSFKVMSSDGRTLYSTTGQIYDGLQPTVDVSSASSVYITANGGSWGYDGGPYCNVATVTFHD